VIGPGRVLVMGLNTKTLAKLSLYINVFFLWVFFHSLSSAFLLLYVPS